jgi:hypothetical protein
MNYTRRPRFCKRFFIRHGPGARFQKILPSIFDTVARGVRAKEKS